MVPTVQSIRRSPKHQTRPASSMESARTRAEQGPFLRPTRRLPTRVSNACRRCRRNKSRCDSYRPCSLCLRADVQCEPASLELTERNAAGRGTRRRPVTHVSPRVSDSGSRSKVTAPTSHVVDSSQSPPSRIEEAVQQVQSDSIRLSESCSSQACVDRNETDSAMSIARKMSKLGSQHGIESFATFAIPDGSNHIQSAPINPAVRLPITAILGSRFPEQKLIYELVEDYFEKVHWFSLVVYEPTFRARLATVEDGNAYPSDLSFLTLLSMVLCMAAKYRENRESRDKDEDWSTWSLDLLGIVESRLISLLDETSLTAAQTCILLGSHYVYHGRPNLSFSLLGATIKIAHALGIHRDLPLHSHKEAEERKRVWWTIYTWDRFASISYGRPLSINDEDYNIEYPQDFAESPYFPPPSSGQQLSGILYSRYQTELSHLYRIASPALKIIFGSISTHKLKQRYESDYAARVSHVTTQLHNWRKGLPPHLNLDLTRDYEPRNGDPRTRAHLLQALSLQLTFDNLLIVLYRPFLAKQVDHLSVGSSNAFSTSPEVTPSSTELPSPPSINNKQSPTLTDYMAEGDESVASDAEYWLSAAVRTAKIAELPGLAQLAKDSHLVAFMAINLFHAATVLILLALSDPLSDRAQKLKRTITRILRLQQLLGRESTLSRQSGVVLQNLISLLLKREGDAMMGGSLPAHGICDNAQNAADRAQSHGPSGALSDPLPQMQGTGVVPQNETDAQMWPNLAVAHQLNESLTSVQRVLPTSSVPAHAFRTDRSSFDEGGPMCNPAHKNRQEGSVVDSAGASVDGGSNGLFWLWDFNWDTGFMQP